MVARGRTLPAGRLLRVHPSGPRRVRRRRQCRPARWDSTLGEYILDWDDVRSSSDPRSVALDFARAVFRHACSVCEWDGALAASADGTPPPVA